MDVGPDVVGIEEEGEFVVEGLEAVRVTTGLVVVFGRQSSFRCRSRRRWLDFYRRSFLG